MAENCVHRWIIATPNGQSEVLGECQICGTERMFTVGAWETEASKRGREKYAQKRIRGREKSGVGTSAQHNDSA